MRPPYRRLLSSAVVAVTAVGLVVAGAFVASATVGSRPTITGVAPEAPYTAFTLDGRQGSYQLTGTRVFDVVTGSAVGESISISGGTGSLDSWYLSLRPPAGVTWAAGETYPMARALQESTDGFISLGGEGRGCNEQDGTLTVHEVERSGVNVSAFAATFLIGCESAPDVVAGEVRWNSTVGWRAAHTDPASVQFGDVAAGSPSAAQVVTLTGKGSLPVTFGTAALEGTNAGNFAITGDTCSGATLAYEEACTVTLVADVDTSGGVSAALRVPDDTFGGYKYVRLGANGVGGQPPTTTTPPPATTTPPSATTTPPSATTTPPSATTTPPPAIWNNVGTYYPLEPARILDTREGNGAPARKLGAGRELVLDVAGRGGVPDEGVSAVVLNVTVTNPTGASFLTVYPNGDARPVASSLNVVSGWTGANMVTVGLGSNGSVRIYNHFGTVDVIADVVGFYALDGSMVASLGTGSHYNPVIPQRLFDSREDWGVRLEAGYAARVAIPVDQEWGPHITAVAVNVTAVDGRAPGFLTTWDGVLDPPLASTLNFARGNVVPNMAVVPVSWCDACDGAIDGAGLPSIGVYTNIDTHVIVDIMGVYDDAVLGEGLRFAPMTPERIVDTRDGLGLPGALRAGRTGTVTVPGSIADVDTWGVALNVTAVDPTAYGYVSVWPAGFDGVDRPLVSNLNTAPGQTLPNSVYTLIGPEYGFNVYNHDGRTHLVIDVVGTFYFDLEAQGLVRSAQTGRQDLSPERSLLQGGDTGARTMLQRSGRDGYAVG